MRSQSLIMEYLRQLLILLVVVAETVTSEKNQTQPLPHPVPIVRPQLSIVSGNEEITNQEITVEEGEEVEFGCSMSVSENTQLKIVWWKNGERVNSGPNGIQIYNGSIAIPSVEHHHHGLYQCILEKWKENPPHASVTINVKHKQSQHKFKINTNRQYVNAAIGDTAELYCNYHTNAVDVSIYWLKEGTLLNNDQNKYEIRNNENMEAYQVNHTVLTVKEINASDFGEYKCLVRDYVGRTGNLYLIQEPEPAQFQFMSIEGRSVTIQWSTNSKQLLLEAVLHYRINWSKHWLIETIPAPQHQGSGSWKLQHKFKLTLGIWYVRVKTRNTAGWSKYSKVKTFEIENSLEEKSFRNQKRFISDQLQVASIGGGNGSATKTTSFVALGYSITSLLVISTLVPWFGLC